MPEHAAGSDLNSHSGVWLMAGSDAGEILQKQNAWLWGDRLLSDMTVRLLVQPANQGSDGERCCLNMHEAPG